MTKSILPNIDTFSEIQSGLLERAYQPIIFAAITSMVVGALVYYTLRQDQTLTQLGFWFVLLLLAAMGRLVAGIWYRAGERDIALFSVLWYVVTLYSAMAWASAPFLIWPESAAHQSFLALVLAGMSGGTIGTLAAMPMAVPLYVTTCMTPLLWRLSSHHTETSNAMLMLGMVYVIWVTVAGIRTHRTVKEGVVSSNERQKAERTIEHQALYDDLTDLPNRRLFLDRLQQALSGAKRNAEYGALMFIDLDNFKRINDSLGHQAGDELLNWVATRLQLRLRDSDTVARLGGDEFAAVVPSLGGSLDKSLIQAEKLADSLRQAISTPIVAGGYEMQVTASIGIVSFPRGEEDALELLKHADSAMYAAKRAGRNCSRIFSQAMDEKTRHRLKTEIAIRNGLEREEFVTYYQPQVDEHGKVFGLEALVRWHRNGEDLLEPAEFLGIAEDSGLIKGIQAQVLKTVIKDLQRLATISDEITVSVNVGANEFYRPGFSENIINLLNDSGVAPNKLCIEITESMAMQQLNTVVSVMNELREIGVRFAIDDFGTGYSSLVHLKTLPIDTLKIDRSFISEIKEGSTDAEIVKAIIAMTKQMGIRTIAEGVESKEVAEYLWENDCSFHQGWVYGKAEPLEDLFSATLPRQLALPEEPKLGISAVS